MDRVSLRTWLFPTLLCLILSVVYLFEWRASRTEQRQSVSRFADTITALNRKFSLERTQTRSLLQTLRSSIGDVAARLEELASRQGALTLAQPGVAFERDVPQETEVTEVVETTVEEELPELPPGTNASRLLDSFDARRFYSNPAFNPSGREPDRVETLKVGNLVTRAKARRMTLRSDINLLVGKEMDRMFEERLFVEYGNGQRRIAQEGVYTSGEPIEGGGMRIYSFLPEEYPGLYEMREEVRRIPQETVRRLMALAMKSEGR